MDSREILELENKLLDPTTEEPISLPLHFLRSITNDFSNEQELGRGGYGVVYKVLSNWRNRFERSSKYTSPELHTQLVKQCINIALECVHPEKEKRPNVSNIIEILNAAEGSCVQNGEDLLVDHQIGAQEGVLQPDVQREDGLMDHRPAWITKGIMKSAAAPLQPQREPVLESVDGSLCYQGSRNASFWVAHKALASLEDNLLKDWAATINLGPGVTALQLELLSVKAILESTLGKVIHNSALEHCLMMLQDLVYDAEDVVDEMEYFHIQDMLDASQHAEELPSVHDEPPKLRFDRDNASRRIEHIVEQMQLIEKKFSSAIKLLGSDWSTTPNIAQSRPITISESIEPKLYGRELMVKSIIDDITKGKHSGEVFTVIPIIGPGGIGKTTVAQHIYHSGEVQKHFDVKVWTCVSLNFNVNKLIEEIQRYIPKDDHESCNGAASELIGQRLKNKRFLLVLDDIWDCCDEDEWKWLLVPFRKSQVLGNIIIVTTRFPAQAHIMVRKNDHSIYLQGLDSEPFEELLLNIIFGDDDQSRKDHIFLLEIGIMIAGRLKGSPLAAKTVGRLLKTQLDLVHWTRVLESKQWEHSNGEELINFWIGQEALHYSPHGESKRVEDIGLSHLTELVNYGFLEDEGEKDGRTCYIIHDLLHELARKVSSLECLSIDTQSQMQNICDIIDLPRDVKNLVKLRHLLVQDDTIHSSITDVGKLKSLQELRRFVVKQDHQGFELRQIGHLEELHGSLCIDSLEKVHVPEEADEAKLMLKSHLHELILRWNINWLADDFALQKHVLERLKPNRNLQKLSIIGHRGGTCPSWLSMNLSLSSLKSLCLHDVNWKTFPPIGDLWLVNVPREEISINIPEKRDCSQLVELSFSHSAGCCQQGKDANDNLFPRLKELKIKRCPQLLSFAPIPWTEAPCDIKIKGISSLDRLVYGKEKSYLTIEGNNKDTNDSTVTGLAVNVRGQHATETPGTTTSANKEDQQQDARANVDRLEIDDVAGFTAAAIRHSLLFSSLTELCICVDHKVKSLTEEQEALLFVDSLEDITLSGRHNLQSLPERLPRHPNLKRLHILTCGAIQMLPKEGLPSSLQELDIIDCPKIQSLPKVDDLPSSLRYLNVRYSGSEELRRQCRKLINIIPIVQV
ncbi:unnamed protein product [Miscanthus lutarioriparius]|uniref:Uncharacterized protein n=1 Tax=Miscanthus lutarioriparius TaxID=422564 RepID=A0A811RAD8_9POAL|nr:unnamed protein product [Miscanthus lutarioriparius]